MTRQPLLLGLLALLHSAAPTGAAVQGWVVTADGSGVAGVTVSAFAPESSRARDARRASGGTRVPHASAVTAADGSFRLSPVPAVLQLQALREGFAPGFAVVADGEVVTLVVRHAPLVRGVVTAQGRPVAGAVVVWSDGVQDAIARTGPDGRYEVADPAVWAHSLEVSHPDFAPFEWPPESWGRPMPGDPRPEWLSMPSSTEHPPLQHELAPGAPVEGRLVGEGGRGVEGAAIVVDGHLLGRSAADGHFLLRHGPATWTHLRAEAPGLVGSISPAARGPVIMKASRRVSGLVLDAASGQPLASASVSLSDESGETQGIFTDETGHYAFEGLTPARYSLWVQRPDYEPGGREGCGGWADLRTVVVARRDCRLARREPLSGRVVDENQHAVAGALVRLVARGAFPLYTVSDGGALGGAWAVATTATDGSFKLGVGPDVPRRVEWSLIGLKRGYARGVLEPLALPLAGSPVLTLPKGVELSGRVTAADGSPLAGVEVDVLEREGLGAFFGRGEAGPQSSEGWVHTDAAGRFATRVRTVPHDLLFHRRGFVTKKTIVRDPVAENGLAVALEPAAQITGSVFRPDGNPAAGIQVLAFGKNAWPPSSATTAADGSFVLEELAPGTFELHIAKHDVDLGIAKSVEAPSAAVRLDLPRSGSLQGRVFDGKTREPLSEFGVWAESGAQDEQKLRSGRIVDPSTGSFRVEDLPLGETTLNVQAEGYLPKRIEGLGIAEQPAPADLEVALDPGAALRGQVTSEDGVALADVQVSAGTPGADGPDAPEEGGGRMDQTDERGEYELRGVPPGEVELVFRKEGFLTLHKSVDTSQPRADAILSRGLVVQGTVLADGAGVAKARVFAHSSAAFVESSNTETDARGRFQLGGLSAGRYDISARGPDGDQVELEDVDIEHVGPLRLVLNRVPTAVLLGKVVGLGPRDDADLVMIEAEGEQGRASARADASGSFRMLDAPSGRVRVSAHAMSEEGTQRSSRVSELTLEPGSETQTVLEFATGITITGRVTREGEPVAHATVTFQPTAGGGRAAAPTDPAGRYAVIGLEPGPHRVSVSAERESFELPYDVSADAQLDIDATPAALTGRAVDAASGAPLAGTSLSLWASEPGAQRPLTSASAGAAGEFALRAPGEGRYRLLGTRKGYGQATQELELQRGENPPVVLELAAADGLTLSVLDARDRRPLEATVVVRDASRRVVANEHSGVAKDGTLTIALAAGQYLLSTSASGYGTATLPVVAPGRGLEVKLTPGGTLVVESDRSLRGTLRLVGPDGEEYVRCWCNGISSIDLEGRRTVVANVTPASYRVEALDPSGRPLSAPSSVTIREGERTAIRIE